MATKVQQRNAAILRAAVEEAQETGLNSLTRDAVATRANVAQGTVNNAYGTIADLRAAVLEHAVTHEVLPLIAQGLAAGSPIAKNAPESLKTRALASLA